MPEINGFTFLGDGSTAITGWTVGSGDVVHGETPQSFWLNASDGDQLIVLNDDAIGGVSSISQTFDTRATRKVQTREPTTRKGR